MSLLCIAATPDYTLLLCRPISMRFPDRLAQSHMKYAVMFDSALTIANGDGIVSSSQGLSFGEGLFNNVLEGYEMKTLNNFKLLGIAMILAAGLAACDKQPGPAESAGKMIDQSAVEAGNKISETADKVGDKINATTEKVGDKMSAQSEKTGVAINDTEITAKVKAAIFAEAGLSTLQISVETINGFVTLSGSVDTQANSDRAKTLAGAVAGVKDVDNKLVLKSS